MGGASIAAAAEAGGDQRSGWGAWRICYRRLPLPCEQLAFMCE